MAKYLIRETISSDAAAFLMKNPQDRAEVVRPLFEAAGGKLEQYYVACNENTTYLIVDIPDQKDLMALLWVFQAGGGPTSVSATPLITIKESVEVMKKAAALDYGSVPKK